MQRRGGGMPVPDACPFPGTGYCGFYARGGGCPCTSGLMKGGSCGSCAMRGGGCPCASGLMKGGTRKHTSKGGYKATKKNLKALAKWRKGKSIGFTMTSSLKAKGLLPRTSKTMKGKRVVSKKYKH